jgi:2-amino-4-hydroxy-6-hydroxymethyldihydropteridine diphosphokinase
MRVHLSLGSNLGDRHEHIEKALCAIDHFKNTRLHAVSHYYETAPVGGVEQPDFINVAAEIETALAPLELLDATQQVERQAGRRSGLRWGPRALDIDIILWDDQTLETDRLPHPSFRERAFVLAPLTEICPNAVDPVTGKTVTELAKSTVVLGTVRRMEEITP